jgi:hypothetical protein
MKCFSGLLLLLAAMSVVSAQPVNRKQVVQRHKVINTKYDSLSSLSVGNGRFAFTVDVTGLQSFPAAYAGGVPLGTQSEWGWHSFPNPHGYTFSETLQPYDIHGRKVTYSVQIKEPERHRDAVNWYRQNPHRLQLGNFGMRLLKKDGSTARISDIENIHQELDPWSGEIHSKFTLEGIPVDVITYSHGFQDAVSVRIRSALLTEKRLQLVLRFPYPNGEFKDVGTFYGMDDKHSSSLSATQQGAVIKRQIDTARYFVQLKWKGSATAKMIQQHEAVIDPATTNDFEITAGFVPVNSQLQTPSFSATESSSSLYWKAFWTSGAAVDLSGNADPRALELERRIVLSQYLTRLQCAGNHPPQETGLTYNSWFGRPHLEMHWWHGIHFALWGRTELLEQTVSWYKKVSDPALKIAQRQGYKGVRWQKMTDNEGNESPSSVGAFLVWQQPHFIYFAELAYRHRADIKTLNRYSDLVFATAEFMASYAWPDPQTGKYILGNGLIPAQERFKAMETFNPAYELVYWHWALEKAQQWRQRLKMPRNPEWDKVIQDLSPLTIQDGKYLFTESAKDSYTNPEFKTDHPAVFGALGMLPKTTMVDSSVMRNTFDWIMKNWSWDHTWGWDFPMTAMTATRLGLPEQAIDALLMPVQTNTYLNNGHNYQDKRLTLYLPGNGGLLAAVAMMCAGYEGSVKERPGFPKNWKIRYEGFRKMP